MSDLIKTYSQANLTLAWRWVSSNPEYAYKNYFRHIYSAYSAAESAYLLSLGTRLRTETFEPTSSIKVFIPKSSGILRPITLLSVEDQIVYQAFGNLIAERLNRRIYKSYYKQVFGHIYAGKNSLWFYRNWKKGYSSFNDSIRKAVNKNYTYSASFDLAACYDSIDYSVLRYFLQSLNLSAEFIDKLVGLLSHWSAVKSPIFHGHGIPQGPLTSGIISEAILHFFDNSKQLPKDVIYLRYVDDIRLYAKSKYSLRKSLVLLDYASKRVGLFPQSSKIEIHEVKNLNEEIKTVSDPLEPAAKDPDKNQDAVHRRINELSKRYVISDFTRFKFNLAVASPRVSQSTRLLKILENYPHLYSSIFSYFSRYKIVPQAFCKELFALLKSEDPPYFSFHASLLLCLLGKVTATYRHHFLAFAERKWSQLKKVRPGDDFREATLLWILKEGRLSYSETLKLINKDCSWWLTTKALLNIPVDRYGRPSYESLLNDVIRQDTTDPAIVASYLLMSLNCKVLTSKKEVNHIASVGLKDFGLTSSKNSPASKISLWLNEISFANVQPFEWRKCLKNKHNLLERKLLTCRAYHRTDATAFVMGLDVFLDHLIDCLYAHHAHLGHYKLGHIGSVLSSQTSRFCKAFPSFYDLCFSVHELRKESDLAHPLNNSSGAHTRRIKFTELKQIRKKLAIGLNEFIQGW